MEFMNMQGVVEYACMQTWMCNTLPNASSEEWPHFIGLLEALSRYLSKSFNRKGSFQQRKDAARLAEITDAYKEKDVRISLVEIYYIILRYWDDPEVNLKGKTAVYNLLQSMALVQTGWRNDPDDRIILMRKLRKTWIS